MSERPVEAIDALWAETQTLSVTRIVLEAVVAGYGHIQFRAVAEVPNSGVLYDQIEVYRLTAAEALRDLIAKVRA